MPDRNEDRAAERLDRLIADLLAGRHLKATPSDAGDREAIWAAARLAGAREGYPRMSPAFRRRLTGVLEKGEEPPWLTRRAALVAGLAAAAGALTGVGLEEAGRRGVPALGRFAPSAGKSTAATQPASSRAVIDPRGAAGRWADTGLVFAEMVEGEPKRVTAGSVGAFVFRKGNRVVAMSAYCTHLPCELAWKEKEHVLNCPCHDQNFDSEGLSLSEGYKLPALPLVNVRIRSGRVEVLGTA